MNRILRVRVETIEGVGVERGVAVSSVAFSRDVLRANKDIVFPSLT